MIRRFVISLMSLTAIAAAETPRASGTGIDKIPKNAGAPTVDVVTDAQLSARRNAAVANQPLPKPEPPRTSSFTLLEMSTILQGDGHFVLIPKGSVLFFPPALEKRIVQQPSGTAVDWQTFFMENRGWLTTTEVTRDQITGKNPIPENQMLAIQKSSSVVIATLEGGPVTVITKPTPP